MNSDNVRQVILKAKGLSKSFYDPSYIEILKDVDLTVCRGETVAITGRSGEGKSTLLQILGTLDDGTGGTLEINDVTVTRFNRSRLRNHTLAFIFQSFFLLEDYTVIDNILIPAKIARKNTAKGSAAYERALELLENVGLSERKDHQAKLLSGGEKQRTAIARALCNEPDIIFADEPSGNLDRETADQIHQLLINFAKKHHKALVIVTHDPRLSALCESHYHLTDKRLVKV